MSERRSNPIRMVSHMLAAVFNSRAAFHREWVEAGARPGSDPVCGRWTGQWVSEQSGHRGELRCVIKSKGPNRYAAHFYASYSRFFRVGYVTELVSNIKDGEIELSGQEDLGWLAGGTYRSEGRVHGDQFLCHYSCKYDRGTFRLNRGT